MPSPRTPDTLGEPEHVFIAYYADPSSEPVPGATRALQVTAADYFVARHLAELEVAAQGGILYYVIRHPG